MKRVIITDHSFPHVDLEREIIESAGFALETIQPICKTEDDIIRACGKADALLVQWAPVTRRVLEALPNVRCIVRYGVGVNNFDLDAARDLGVVAANVPDFCVEEVANHALAMILSLCRRIPQDHHQILQGGWGVNPFRPIYALTELTLGLVSFGKIARNLARKAATLGFAIIAQDPYVDKGIFEIYQTERVEFAELIERADIVSLHCPLIPETTHLMNRDVFGRMKPGAILINTSRGPVVHEEALIEALKAGTLGGAGLDVFEEEPLPPSSPLRTFANVILTSHAASVSEKAVELLQRKAAEAARDFLEGKDPVSRLV
ncbi:MAG TPA: C-terminal binding protein [Candidatus Hydrogenedentes bacterium]|nr:C-terminal binding protein [Candidatus Hydrogenedentota bacterium]HQH54750.1 C-terminal binding protein [Candidatus Hydrogenedentota bacterium]HQM48187.1 C-terminal binding protein [Candidatus Hydrogenedentota bacterium]